MELQITLNKDHFKWVLNTINTINNNNLEKVVICPFKMDNSIIEILHAAGIKYQIEKFGTQGLFCMRPVNSHILGTSNKFPVDFIKSRYEDMSDITHINEKTIISNNLNLLYNIGADLYNRGM